MLDVTPIKNYILYLKNECGLSISLHPFGAGDLILQSELRPFNIHDNSYCIYVKTHPEIWAHCIKRQKKIIQKCESGSFCGTCFAGVFEYVYPLRDGRSLMGFLSVSGYRGEESRARLRALSERYSIPYESLCLPYESLKPTIPDKARIDTLIEPLCQMLELTYRKHREEQAPTVGVSLSQEVAQYLLRNHTSPITLEDVSRHFSCSPSHISHHFKRETGKSIREYLTELRLEDARCLLRHSELGVTEIAYSVGFHDSNYFSVVFRASEGCSPTAYRRKMKR